MPALKKWLFQNNARSTLKNDILAGDGTLTVNTGDGDLFFPSPNNAVNEAFRVTLIDVNGNLEIVECTQRTADVFNVITRGKEGTLPRNFAAGSRVSMRMTKEIFESFRDQWQTGDYRFTLRNVAANGWRLCDDGTIGNAGSGATYAAADAFALFSLLWTNMADAICPVTPGGRGASAAADFAALKKIALTKTLGRALVAAGAGAGLTARTLGDSTGAEDAVVVQHTHVADPHHHGGVLVNGGVNVNPTGGIILPIDGNTADTVVNIQQTGVSGVGKNMQPSGFGNLELHL